MTDNEIIELLERMIIDYPNGVLAEILDLINRQKAEIERLQKLLDDKCDRCIARDKSEAYKEFAKEVKEEIKKAYDNNMDVFREHLEKHKDNPDFEFLSTITGKTNTLRGLDYFIDNLVKEMVG